MQNLLVLVLISFGCTGIVAQTNLVQNGSLEDWENGAPVHWEIVANTVDIFKSDYRLIPGGVNVSDTSYRARFPATGSDGLTYFGIAHDEVIKCKLTQSPEAGHLYKLVLNVRKPAIFNTRKVTGTFTFRFARNSEPTDTVFIELDSAVEASAGNWEEISTVFEPPLTSDELYFGYFGDTYDHLEFGAIGLYYLFDNIRLYKSEIRTDTLTLRFAPNQYTLSSSQANRIRTALAKPYIDSVFIQGYASVIGKTEDNFNLAGKRVRSVLRLLEPYDLPLTTLNAGETESRVGNEDQDRKVVFEISYHHFREDTPPHPPPAFNKTLARDLAEMVDADQAIRIQLEACESDSIRQVLTAALIRIDTRNQQRLAEIIDRVGYPGLSLVGPEQMDAAFLLIHHSELAQRLEYEPLILEAVQRGEATRSLLPFFIDRNRIDTGEKQIFGTQLYLDEASGRFELFELAYPDQINTLRQEQGLMPLAEYLRLFNGN